MNFSLIDLVPGSVREAGVSEVQAWFSLPLTPFFMHPGTGADLRTRGFHGNDFYLQNKSTRWFDENGVLTDDPICGFAAYRRFESQDFDEEAVVNFTGSIVRSYVFEDDEVRIHNEETGNPTIGLTHSRTATKSYQGDRFNEPPNHTEIELSDAVDKGWLAGQLQAWMAKPDSFRDATGSGLGTYAYVGHGATRTDSDGWLATVGGGHAIVRPGEFWGTPWGMTGDEGELWNGKFSADVLMRTRKNAPAVHRETSDNYSNGRFFATAEGIYRDGYAEIVLTEPTNSWRDDFGVFETGQELETTPLTADYWDSGLSGYNGAGSANKVTFISRTGHQYRITIERGRYEANGWQSSGSEVVTTDATTLQAEYSASASNDDLRIGKIEKRVDDQWQLVAAIENDPSSFPESLVGPSVRGSFVLLCIVQVRRGSRWGFYDFEYNSDGPRYRKKTFRTHRSPGTVNIDSGECGSGFSGSYDCEWTEEYKPDTGLLIPRNVSQWSATFNGVAWTPENPPDSIYFTGSTEATSTATHQRRQGTHTWNGRFLAAFDVPTPYGKILSESVARVTVEFDGETNKSAPIAMDPPASGTSVFFAGYRLTYP